MAAVLCEDSGCSPNIPINQWRKMLQHGTMYKQCYSSYWLYGYDNNDKCAHSHTHNHTSIYSSIRSSLIVLSLVREYAVCTIIEHATEISVAKDYVHISLTHKVTAISHNHIIQTLYIINTV